MCVCEQVKRDKIVRKPTAFNHFVREKMADLKAQGTVIEEDKNNNELFKVCSRSCTSNQCAVRMTWWNSNGWLTHVNRAHCWTEALS